MFGKPHEYFYSSFTLLWCWNHTSKTLIGCKSKCIEAEGKRHTVHLALIGENDLASAAGRIDGQRLLKALLDVRTPHALRIVLQRLIQSLAQLLTSAPRRGRWYPLGRQGGGGEQNALADTDGPAEALETALVGKWRAFPGLKQGRCSILWKRVSLVRVALD